MNIVFHTDAQAELLGKNPHLIPVADLGDGDILVVDRNVPKPDVIDRAITHYGPYILTCDGKVQDVNYHYARYHDLQIAF